MFMNHTAALASLAFSLLLAFGIVAWTAFVLFSPRAARLFPTWRRRRAAVWTGAILYGATAAAVIALIS